MQCGDPTALEPLLQMGHTGAIRGVSTALWQPYAVTVGSDRYVHLWNVSAGKVQFSTQVDEDVLGVSLHPMGNHFLPPVSFSQYIEMRSFNCWILCCIKYYHNEWYNSTCMTINMNKTYETIFRPLCCHCDAGFNPSVFGTGGPIPSEPWSDPGRMSQTMLQFWRQLDGRDTRSQSPIGQLHYFWDKFFLSGTQSRCKYPIFLYFLNRMLSMKFLKNSPTFLKWTFEDSVFF